ncbi:FAS1 domain-containing protein [Xylariaceae sp. FL1272]|nr:FAS1 domain-containing protein [Xylariaceae sp. FL1272]
MRYSTLLPLVAAAATAFVIPDEETAQQVFGVEDQSEKSSPKWWEGLHSKAEEAFDLIGEHTHKLIEDLSEVDVLGSIFDIETGIDEADIFGFKPGNGHVGKPGHHGTTNLTVYEAIQKSNFTKKFAKLVDEFPDIVDLLNSTSANVTAFVPIDKAFEKIPDHHKKPPKEFLEAIIKYHVLPGFYPAGRVLASHTLPTALKSKALGDRPQRLRVSVGLFGLRVNFYSKVVVANLFAKNGIAHGVDSLLFPPPPAKKLISLFPSKFSTLELAAEKTGLLPHHDHKHKHDDDGDDDHKHEDSKHHHGHGSTGLTIFAPTNFAFRKLGPAANAFLFNSEKGLHFLKALLKYHIVVNETLYSDAYYGLKSGSIEEVQDRPHHNGHFHVDLPTLLDDRSLSVDIARWYGFINMRINGYTNVAVEDGCAFDGVVQVMNSVLIPPRDGKKGTEWTEEEDGWISVEELVERLAPFVDEEVVEGAQLEMGSSEKEQVWNEL